jgi:sortase A
VSLTVRLSSPTSAEDSPSPFDRVGVDAWALCAELVEWIVSEAQAAAVRDNPGSPRPEVDRQQIWRAGEGAPSDEVAISRIVHVTSEWAHRIAPGLSTSPTWVEGRVISEADVTARSHVGDSALVEPLVEPPAAPAHEEADAVSQPVEPLTASPEPVVETEGGPEAPDAAATPPAQVLTPAAPPPPEPEPAHVVADPDEPVTAPVESVLVPELVTRVVSTSATFDSATLDRPRPAATPLVEPADLEPLPIDPLFLVEPAEVPTERASRDHAGWATFFTWVRNVGAIMLLFVVWQLWGTSISQHQAQDQLRSAFEASLRAHHPPKTTGPGPALIPAATRVPSPSVGTVVAELQIPAIGVDQFVVEGTDATELSKGPGHYVGTAAPGQAGNVAIAGHRTTNGAPFNRLGQLTRGDRIIVTTTSGEHLTYVVSGTPQAVSPGDVAVLNYFGDNRITLTTCTPEFSAAQRLVAVGMLQQAGASPKAPASSVTYHVVNPATASWDWSSLPAVGLLLCLLVLLGLSYRRFEGWFGKHGKWFILVPVWTAGLYLLFSSLITFLPETF